MSPKQSERLEKIQKQFIQPVSLSQIQYIKFY